MKPWARPCMYIHNIYKLYNKPEKKTLRQKLLWDCENISIVWIHFSWMDRYLFIHLYFLTSIYPVFYLSIYLSKRTSYYCNFFTVALYFFWECNPGGVNCSMSHDSYTLTVENKPQIISLKGIFFFSPLASWKGLCIQIIYTSQQVLLGPIIPQLRGML